MMTDFPERLGASAPLYFQFKQIGQRETSYASEPALRKPRRESPSQYRGRRVVEEAEHER